MTAARRRSTKPLPRRRPETASPASPGDGGDAGGGDGDAAAPPPQSPATATSRFPYRCWALRRRSMTSRRFHAASSPTS
jgi:hypothetical protein